MGRSRPPGFDMVEAYIYTPWALVCFLLFWIDSMLD